MTTNKNIQLYYEEPEFSGDEYLNRFQPIPEQSTANIILPISTYNTD